MPVWSEKAFQQRVALRAQQLGQPLKVLLAQQGVGHDTVQRNVGSRSIKTLERIAAALKWDLAEVIGYPGLINRELSWLAASAAERILTRLPEDARTLDLRTQAHADIYDLLIARRREGRWPTDTAARAEILAAYEEMMVQAWYGRDAIGPKTPAA